MPCRWMHSEPQIPRLSDQVAPEAMVRLFAGQLETSLLVQAARRSQLTLRPECDLAIPRTAGEAHALADQGAADAQAAGRGLHQQEAELGDGLRFSHQQNGAEIFARPLRDPATLALRIMPLAEGGDDLGYQR